MKTKTRMKPKTKNGLIIAGTIVGGFAVSIVAFVMLSGIGLIETSHPNLIFDTYKGMPVYRETIIESDDSWADIIIDGEVYTHRNLTPWRAKEIGNEE